MSVKKIISAILFASTFIHSEEIDSANAEYCLDLRKVEEPTVLLVKQNRAVEIQFAEKPAGCEFIYGQTAYAEITYMDESGNEVCFDRTISGVGYGGGGLPPGSRYGDRFPPVIRYDFPSKMSPRVLFHLYQGDMLRFTGKIIDGYKEVTFDCSSKPKATYKLNFRIKVTGKCAADFLSDYDRGKRR